MRYGRTPRRKGDEIDSVPSWDEIMKFTHYDTSDITSARLQNFIEHVTEAHFACCNYVSSTLKNLQPRMVHYVCFHFSRKICTSNHYKSKHVFGYLMYYIVFFPTSYISGNSLIISVSE